MKIKRVLSPRLIREALSWSMLPVKRIKAINFSEKRQCTTYLIWIPRNIFTIWQVADQIEQSFMEDCSCVAIREKDDDLIASVEITLALGQQQRRPDMDWLSRQVKG